MSNYDYEGFHATADILLNEYPENIVDIFEQSLKYSNLNIVSEHIHDFGGAVTGVYVLAESSASIHEYPEHNYVTVDVYTCGKEGDPEAAIKEFIKQLDVKDYVINFLNRGDFTKNNILLKELAFHKKETKESLTLQKQLNQITDKLSKEEVEQLDLILKWSKREGMSEMEDFYAFRRPNDLV